MTRRIGISPCVPVFALALALGLAATMLQAAALRDHEGVNRGLLIAGIVTMIEETCPSFGVRRIRGLLYLRSLYNMAQSAGFSREEIEAHVDSEEEEARLRRRVDAWLAIWGAEPGNAESYCAIGRDHVNRRTRIGLLLRAK